MEWLSESFYYVVGTLNCLFLLIGAVFGVREIVQMRSAGKFPGGTLEPWKASFSEVFSFFGIWLLSFIGFPQIGFWLAGIVYPGIDLSKNPVYAVGFYQPLVLVFVWLCVSVKYSKLTLANAWNASGVAPLCSRFSLCSGQSVWTFFGVLLLGVSLAGVLSQCVPILIPVLKDAWAQNQILVDNLRALEHPSVLWILVPSLIVFTPIVEEIFFRAGLYRLLKSQMPAIPAALLTGLGFALLHDSLAGIIPLAVLSCILCYAYERTGKLAVPIILHGLFNLNTLLLLFSGAEG